jgi:hypothetical protein
MRGWSLPWHRLNGAQPFRPAALRTRSARAASWAGSPLGPTARAVCSAGPRRGHHLLVKWVPPPTHTSQPLRHAAPAPPATAATCSAASNRDSRPGRIAAIPPCRARLPVSSPHAATGASSARQVATTHTRPKRPACARKVSRSGIALSAQCIPPCPVTARIGRYGRPRRPIESPGHPRRFGDMG